MARRRTRKSRRQRTIGADEPTELAAHRKSSRRKSSKRRRSREPTEPIFVPREPTAAKTSQRKNSRRRSSATSGGPPARSVTSRLLRFCALVFVWILIAATLIVAYYAYDLPDISKLKQFQRRPQVALMDRSGARLASYGDLYGAPIRLSRLPRHVPQAVIAIEDRRFHSHFGIDIWGLVRAAAVNLYAGRIREGGSTITQQLAKNVFLTPKRSIRRKVQEILLAIRLELAYSKNEILTIYLNRVYLGAGTYGIDAAARKYFGRPARRLTLYQSAVLAGLLKAPSRLNPLNNPKLAVRRANLVLASMVKAGYITPARAAKARRNKGLVREPGGGLGHRYFTDWVLEQARAHVGYSKRDLVIVTTLSPSIQRLAEAHTARTLTLARGKRVSQAAVVVLSPDGAVRALVGGRDYGISQYNRVTQARRQPGSTFKAFVLLAALESGITPDDRFNDAPIRIRGWRPHNYKDKYFGDVTLKEAMVRSLNSVAVQVSEKVGRRRVIRTARRLGIASPLKPRPSIALGASEVSLIELTGAYATFANGGRRVRPHAIIEIRSRGGKVLYRRRPRAGRRVVAARHVAAMNDILSAVIAEGTGKAARIERPAAGKTGTSQRSRDAWFIGYTAHLVTGVWVGNDNSKPMRGVTGGDLPARLWARIMRAAHAGRPAKDLYGVGN